MPKVLKVFPCSTQLSMKFQLLRESKILKNNIFFCLKQSNVVFILLINVKMPTIVGILTFMSRINFKLSWGEHEKFHNHKAMKQVTLWEKLYLLNITEKLYVLNVTE